jgi:hypothetical protein
MIITLCPELEAALNETARRLGITPEALTIHILRERLLGASRTIEPRDEWERRLLGAAVDCGVSLTNGALSSEGLYD